DSLEITLEWFGNFSQIFGRDILRMRIQFAQQAFDGFILKLFFRDFVYIFLVYVINQGIHLVEALCRKVKDRRRIVTPAEIDTNGHSCNYSEGDDQREKYGKTVLSVHFRYWINE